MLFKPEFLNRLDEIVVFKTLTHDELFEIVDLLVADLQSRLIAQGMALELTSAAKEIIVAQGNDHAYGARPLRRAIQTLVEDPLSEELLEGKWHEGDYIIADAMPDEDVESAEGGTTGTKIAFRLGKGEIPTLSQHESLADRDTNASLKRYMRSLSSFDDGHAMRGNGGTSSSGLSGGTSATTSG